MRAVRVILLLYLIIDFLSLTITIPIHPWESLSSKKIIESDAYELIQICIFLSSKDVSIWREKKQMDQYVIVLPI